MDRRVREDMARSQRAFRDIVWPEIGDYLGDGVLESLESGTDDLDRTGGLDGYQRLRTAVRTYAQRTQFIDDCDKPATFTIRYSRQSRTATEFQKRYDAWNTGFELPGLVIQAYVHEAKQYLIRAAVTHGRLFYPYVFAAPDRWRRLRAADGSASFLVVPWWQIHKDNARDRCDVPVLSKDFLGVVARTPQPFFDRQPPPFRAPLGMWI